MPTLIRDLVTEDEVFPHIDHVVPLSLESDGPFLRELLKVYRRHPEAFRRYVLGLGHYHFYVGPHEIQVCHTDLSQRFQFMEIVPKNELNALKAIPIQFSIHDVGSSVPVLKSLVYEIGVPVDPVSYETDGPFFMDLLKVYRRHPEAFKRFSICLNMPFIVADDEMPLERTDVPSRHQTVTVVPRSTLDTITAHPTQFRIADSGMTYPTLECEQVCEISMETGFHTGTTGCVRPR